MPRLRLPKSSKANSPSRCTWLTTTRRVIDLKSRSSPRTGHFAVEESGGEEYAQFAQLVDGEGDVAVFAVEVFGQVEQQDADAGEGFVAVGDEGFVAGVGGDGEEGG